MTKTSILLLFFFLFLSSNAHSGTINGLVTDSAGKPIPYSSIIVKGKKINTSTNQWGRFILTLDPGRYTIICRHVGYASMEQVIDIVSGEYSLQFMMLPQEVMMDEVVIKAGSEDPAYAIIRNAIRTRNEHQKSMRSYTCEVYSKGVMNLRDFPASFLGKKVNFEDGDTSRKKMIYLSESLSRLSVSEDNKSKTEVLSTRVSGQSDGFGFAGARFFSFYANNVQLSNTLNPRGFISPIADGAFQYYRFKYEGMFIEDGKWINQIRVIPKRTYEPCFSGMIQIVENEWTIYSLQLKLLKENQMSFADTLLIEQMYQSFHSGEWQIQSQVLYPSVRFFGFDAYGSFLNIYRNFNLKPEFVKGYFDNIILKFEEGSNKKERMYWDSIRPVQLADAEKKDYLRKDSLEQLRKNPTYLDSLDRIRNKISLSELLVTGKTFSRQKRKSSFTMPSLIQAIGFNPAEGMVTDFPFTWNKSFSDRQRLVITPHLRYGFSSKRLFGWGTVRYTTGNKYRTVLSASGGSRVFQFNPDNPIEPFQNTVSALLYKNNFMKIYASNYARLTFDKSIGYGVNVQLKAMYEDRMPMENKTDYSWDQKKLRGYFPNYPSELGTQNFTRHQALVLSGQIRLQPGARYIEFPDRIFNVGSKWPVFTLSYSAGIHSLLGSDVDFGKWKLSVNDDLNFRLQGRLFYRIETGGFLQNRRVEWQDLNHFPGNRLIRASDFMSRFQLPVYYGFSNADRLYGLLFAEHHFNGFLTNKIPVIRKWNWHLVGGVGYLYRENSNYFEWHVGIENIMRVFRVDIVKGYLNGKGNTMEFRIGTALNIGTASDD